nr:hypothetical protein [Candidatus Sigynarchaeota archaeon]
QEKLKKDEKEVTFTVTGCMNCEGTDETREYKDGDIVFAVIGEKCKACGKDVVIKQIYLDIIKKK